MTDENDQAAATERYLSAGYREVQGWLSPVSAAVMAALAAWQSEQGLTGNLAEIGVHHGKSFLVLATSARAGETAVALDVFDDVDKNVDSSGRGDREVLEANLARWAPGVTVRIVQASSAEIEVGSALEVFGGVRLMSVDGGHTAEITRHDLTLAESVVIPGGLVVLDDLLNVAWLGVLTGAAAYFTGPHRLVPCAMSPNKLYCTTSEEDARRYRAYLLDSFPEILIKRDVPLFGYDIDVYGQQPRWVEGTAPDAWQLARDRSVADLRAQLVTASAERTDLHRQVADLTRRLAAMKASRDEAAAELRDARRDAERLRSSTSWKLTAPLRAAGRLRRGSRTGPDRSR